MDFVLNLGAYEMAADKVLAQELQKGTPRPHLDTSVTTVTFERLGTVDPARFDSWLEGLLWEGPSQHGMQIMRMKGVVALAGASCRCIVQGVYEIFDKTLTTAWEADEPRLNRLVFIGTCPGPGGRPVPGQSAHASSPGRHLDRTRIVATFEECLPKVEL